MHQHADQCIRIPITIMTQYFKIVTEAIEKENMQDQRKFKIVTSAISAYASRLMCLKMKAVDTTNSSVSQRETIKYIPSTSKIICNLVSNQ